MENTEFWIATATDDDGGLHWSDIIWSDGHDIEGALDEARDLLESTGADGGLASKLTVFGPFKTNSNAACTVAF